MTLNSGCMYHTVALKMHRRNVMFREYREVTDISYRLSASQETIFIIVFFLVLYLVIN